MGTNQRMNDFIRRRGRRPVFDVAESGPETLDSLQDWILGKPTPRVAVNHGSADGAAGQGQTPKRDSAQLVNQAIREAYQRKRGGV
jgi:hypothetical protein